MANWPVYDSNMKFNRTHKEKKMEGQKMRDINPGHEGMDYENARPSRVFEERDFDEGPAIPQQLGEMDKAISMLGEEIGMLFDKILPVTGPEGPDKMSDPGDDTPQHSEIWRVLEDQTSRITQIRRRVTSIRSRIEL